MDQKFILRLKNGLKIRDYNIDRKILTITNVHRNNHSINVFKSSICNKSFEISIEQSKSILILTLVQTSNIRFKEIRDLESVLKSIEVNIIKEWNNAIEREGSSKLVSSVVYN